MAGQIALWITFWLIGTPLAVLWDLSGLCTVVGCGIQDPMSGVILLALFALSSIAIPFVSVAIWRSSNKYPRQTWSQSALAFGAKLCASLSALVALIGLSVLAYIASIFIYAAFDRA